MRGRIGGARATAAAVQFPVKSAAEAAAEEAAAPSGKGAPAAVALGGARVRLRPAQGWLSSGFAAQNAGTKRPVGRGEGGGPARGWRPSASRVSSSRPGRVKILSFRAPDSEVWLLQKNRAREAMQGQQGAAARASHASGDGHAGGVQQAWDAEEVRGQDLDSTGRREGRRQAQAEDARGIESRRRARSSREPTDGLRNSFSQS